jgi:hypothetical protein
MAIGGKGEVTLTWSPPRASGGRSISGYRVMYGTSVAAGSIAAADTGTTGTTYTLRGVTNGSQYFIKIAAVTSAGVGEYAFVQAIPAGTPEEVTSLVATPSDESVTVTFAAPTVNGGSTVNSYRVQMSSDATTWSEITAVTISSGSLHSIVWVRVLGR